MTIKFNRICLVVLDSAGIGEMPDASAWGDAGSNTLGHIFESRKVNVPNLQAMGLGNITPLDRLAAVEHPTGSYGKCTLKSDGKDTTTGHWEMAGIILKQGFPKFPDGFPPRIIDEFVDKARVPGILGNVPASGTEIIKELGEEHVRNRQAYSLYVCGQRLSDRGPRGGHSGRSIVRDLRDRSRHFAWQG